MRVNKVNTEATSVNPIVRMEKNDLYLSNLLHSPDIWIKTIIFKKNVIFNSSDKAISQGHK